ncbi:MAG: hypothetical protein JXB32_18695 [Deltaproteobacteria bacterium]|nr:hypothetical protein [Deltaproteobacteria bacterium]
MEARRVVVEGPFVFLCMALVVGFRLHQAESDEAERRGHETGITRYRRELKPSNRDKVIVFLGAHFGIFPNYEFALLCGLVVRERAILAETPQTVLGRHGAVLPNSQAGTS